MIRHNPDGSITVGCEPIDTVGAAQTASADPVKVKKPTKKTSKSK